jgi:hypothetical protein
MKLAHWFVAMLAVGMVGAAKADTEGQVRNVTVAMTIPGGGTNPLAGQTFKHFGEAQSAMRGAHADASFLVQKEQTAGNLGANILTKFWIPGIPRLLLTRS